MQEWWKFINLQDGSVSVQISYLHSHFSPLPPETNLQVVLCGACCLHWSVGGEAEDTSVSLASRLSDVERRREEERGGGTHAETFMAVSALPTLFHGLPPATISNITKIFHQTKNIWLWNNIKRMDFSDQLALKVKGGCEETLRLVCLKRKIFVWKNAPESH